MIRKTTLPFLLAVLALLNANVAQAEFSQLEFDRPSKKVGTPPKVKKKPLDLALEVLLEKEKKATADSATRARLSDKQDVAKKLTKKQRPAAKAKTAPAKKEVYRHEIRFPTDRTEIHDLTPRLKGPFIDKGEESIITSKYRWDKSKSGSCGVPTKRADVINKSNAIKEVLFRFGGSHQAYDSLVENFCAAECSPESQDPRLIGLAVESARGGVFSIDQDETSCAYQLTKESSSSWKKLEVSKIVCGCFNQ